MDALSSGLPTKTWRPLAESVELPTQHANGAPH
jgi:hypothetical protein